MIWNKFLTPALNDRGSVTFIYQPFFTTCQTGINAEKTGIINNIINVSLTTFWALLLSIMISRLFKRNGANCNVIVFTCALSLYGKSNWTIYKKDKCVQQNSWVLGLYYSSIFYWVLAAYFSVSTITLLAIGNVDTYIIQHLISKPHVDLLCILNIKILKCSEVTKEVHVTACSGKWSLCSNNL